MFTLSAAVLRLDGDPGADRDTCIGRLEDGAAELVPQRDRRPLAGQRMHALHRDRVWPIDVLVQVAPADAAVGHADAQLAGAQTRLYEVDQTQVARTVPAQGSHGWVAAVQRNKVSTWAAPMPTLS